MMGKRRKHTEAQKEHHSHDNIQYVSVDMEQTQHDPSEQKISHVHVTDEGIHFEVRILHHPAHSGASSGSKIIETSVHVPEPAPAQVATMHTVPRHALEMMMLGTLLDFIDLEMDTPLGWTCTGSGYEGWLQFLQVEGTREETMRVAIEVAIRACVERGIEYHTLPQ